MRPSILAGCTLAACALLLLAPGTAKADDPDFGKAGNLTISWDQPLGTAVFDATTRGFPLAGPGSASEVGFEYTTAGNESVTLFTLAPAADFFVIDHLSIGGQVLLGFGSVSPGGNQPSTGITVWGIAPQVGYDFMFSDVVSVWPKLFLSFDGYGYGNNGGSGNGGTLGIYVPFLFHLAPHFFVGIGPNLDTELWANASPGGNAPSVSVGNKPTTVGAMATFGGWFNL